VPGAPANPGGAQACAELEAHALYQFDVLQASELAPADERNWDRQVSTERTLRLSSLAALDEAVGPIPNRKRLDGAEGDLAHLVQFFSCAALTVRASVDDARRFRHMTSTALTNP